VDATLNLMDSLQRLLRQFSSWFAMPLAFFLALAIAGCASPGLPRPPSLNLPEPARDLMATRIGNSVELQFTIPSRSTDKFPLRGSPFTARFCRELNDQACIPIASSKTKITEASGFFISTDILPSDLTHGSPRTLVYRVQISNPNGHSAGDSAPAFTAVGAAPPPVEGFHAEGSRLGIVLHWKADSTNVDDVALQREDLGPKSGLHQLTPPYSTINSSLLDTTVKLGVPYRYIASRHRIVQLDGRAIEIHSAPSPAIDITLRPIYPPLAPTGLNTAAFFSPTDPSVYSVDLIWQPVDEPSVIVALAGYNLYRESLDSVGHPLDSRIRLNQTPIVQPSFHDATADPTVRYRYIVTAIDAKGNESGPASAILEPSKL
jgi:hypothetical protein